MALPGRHDTTLHRGDTKKLTFVFRQAAVGDQPARPVDFTGHVGLAQVRRSARASEPLAVMTVTFPDPEGGVMRVVLSAAESTKVVSNAVYDVQTTNSDGDVRTWMKGTITLDADGDVTR